MSWLCTKSGKARMVSSKNEVSFEKWYFENWHAYDKKRTAIQRLYYDVLSWSNEFAPFDVLEGKGRAALDVGCAHGYTVELLERLGYNACGCDIATYYVRNYAKNVASNLVACDAHKLPFRKAAFDIIASFELIEHLHDQISFLKDCFACLKPDGALVLQTPKGIPSVDAIFSKMRSRAVSKGTDVEHHVSTLVNTSDLMRLLDYCGFKAHVETWFLLPIKPTFANRYFATRIPTTVPTFRAIAAKDR